MIKVAQSLKLLTSQFDLNHVIHFRKLNIFIWDNDTETPAIHQMKRSTLQLYLVVSQNKQKKVEQGKNVDAHSINSLF